MKNTQIAKAIRRNPIGIQMLSPGLHKQLFPKSLLEASGDHIKLAQKHLETHQLWGKTSKDIENIDFELPKLLGSDLAEHFRILGREQEQEYGDQANELACCEIPKQPEIWSQSEGWTRYSVDGTSSSVEYPSPDESLIFDVEVLYKISHYPVLATACSPKAWYSWVMPGFFDLKTKTPNHLIPLGYPERKRLIVGHFVAFDRARILVFKRINYLGRIFNQIF
jgi:DNA polymerase gamma 1